MEENWNQRAADLLMARIAALKADGISGAEIGRILGVSRATISYWENGQRSPASSPDLMRYLQRLGIGEDMNISAELVPSNVRRFQRQVAMKRLPIYDINAPSCKREEVEPSSWMEVPADFFLGDADFVIHLKDYYVMQQDIPEGSLVGVKRIDSSRLIKSGHIYLMWWEYEGLVVRYAYLDQNSKMVVCRAHNDSTDDFPPQSFPVEQAREFTIGMVVWKMAKS